MAIFKKEHIVLTAFLCLLFFSIGSMSIRWLLLVGWIFWLYLASEYWRAIFGVSDWKNAIKSEVVAYILIVITLSLENVFFFEGFYLNNSTI